MSSGALPPLVELIPRQPPDLIALAALAGIEALLIAGWLWRLSRA